VNVLKLKNSHSSTFIPAASNYLFYGRIFLDGIGTNYRTARPHLPAKLRSQDLSDFFPRHCVRTAGTRGSIIFPFALRIVTDDASSTHLVSSNVTSGQISSLLAITHVLDYGLVVLQSCTMRRYASALRPSLTEIIFPTHVNPFLWTQEFCPVIQS